MRTRAETYFTIAFFILFTYQGQGFAANREKFTEPIHLESSDSNEVPVSKHKINIRGKEFEIGLRGVVRDLDNLVALLDVNGELFAGTAGTQLTLRFSDITANIKDINEVTRTVAMEYDDKKIEFRYKSEPLRGWKLPHKGISASLKPLADKFPYNSKVMVQLTLENISDREILIDLGWKDKPHFWFIMSYSRLGEVASSPAYKFSRQWDFSQLKKPLLPKKLLPGEKLTFDFDLNHFLEHGVGTPEMMASIPIGSAPAWYKIAGIYQQLADLGHDVWTGSTTTNSIEFRVLPKEKVITKFYQLDDEGIIWDYNALSEAYASRSGLKEDILNLMVDAKAVHLVPQIIDSIRPGGFLNVEQQMQAIIHLTGHDFSKDFDIKGIWQTEHVNKVKSILRKWWKKHGEQVIKSRGAVKEFIIPENWKE